MWNWSVTMGLEKQGSRSFASGEIRSNLADNAQAGFDAIDIGAR